LPREYEGRVIQTVSIPCPFNRRHCWQQNRLWH